jgi:uncharacterized protein YggE
MSLWDFMFLGGICWAIAIGAKQYKDMQLKREDPEEFKKQKAEEAVAKAKRAKMAGLAGKGAAKILYHMLKK